MGNREMLNVQGSVFLLASRKFTASLNTKVSMKKHNFEGQCGDVESPFHDEDLLLFYLAMRFLVQRCGGEAAARRCA